MQHALVFLNLEKIASKQQGIWVTIQIAESLDSLSSKAKTVFYTKTQLCQHLHSIWEQIELTSPSLPAPKVRVFNF
jgi:hypothetical protein